ncbi:hypothetical protein KU6B_13810 [Mameliella alba]|uniref:NAD(P)-binding domain-containing protein n=1 Tax=Mameliella alba TaxID=561184 RepID=UPI0013E50063|nr:NAD(P)-binding domain-containing protein [Mameliella alba]BBU55116.1 hypothetical protein KU6B_13810 [Mameliella alba]
MKIAILGSGLMGAALGPVWAQAGHAVTFRHARSADKLVLNCCVPLDEANETLVFGTDTSGAGELAQMRPQARRVS